VTRYKLTLEYDGRGLVGWQRQDNGPSVQAALETAVKRFCGEAVSAQAAGRTDSGVHALGQVAHVDLDKATDGDTLRDALNFHLKPAAVAVLSAEAVAPDFHARFSAVERRYRYRIVNRRARLTLDEGRAWFVPVPLDAGAMGAAAQALVGRHDFTSFRASECQAKSPVKTLDALEVSREGEEIRIEARARSFLHHQVRNMVGTLKLVGEGKWTRDDVTRALAARDRKAAGPTAPAHGLYLVAVRY
jgi:tRNA pseudouridine38-40 synthase